MKIIIVTFLLINSLQAFGEAYKVEEVEFLSNGEKLSGSLVFPKSEKIHSAVVFVHGSGEQARNMHWAQGFASEGIVALVYDKRGVGRSGGKYEGRQSVSEKNISLLADDARAALNFLSEHPETKAIPLGFTGISQAGWIIPLAAEKNTALDFIALWSSPVCKVSEEDIFSKYTADLDGIKIPSYNEALISRDRKYIWPSFLGKDTDPSISLSKLSVPGLWVFGEKDGSVPVDLSVSRLQNLIDSGHRYEYILFSKHGHNNMSETFATVTDWIERVANEM